MAVDAEAVDAEAARARGARHTHCFSFTESHYTSARSKVNATPPFRFRFSVKLPSLKLPAFDNRIVLLVASGLFGRFWNNTGTISSPPPRLFGLVRFVCGLARWRCVPKFRENFATHRSTCLPGTTQYSTHFLNMYRISDGKMGQGRWAPVTTCRWTQTVPDSTYSDLKLSRHLRPQPLTAPPRCARCVCGVL